MPDDDLSREVDDAVESRMLVICDTDDGLEVDNPGGQLNDDERVGILVRALVTELARDIVAALESIDEDDD